MGRVLLDMAVTLDGYVGGAAGEDVGLYDWYFDPQGESRAVVEELQQDTGAIMIGRGAFGLGDDAGGWEETPYDVEHFVLTHRPPAPLPAGPVRFTFVADLAECVARAKVAAGDRWVALGGGPDTARQCLAAGLVDEVQLHVVPKLLGGGQPLFGPHGPVARLEQVRVVRGPEVTHLRYAVTAG